MSLAAISSAASAWPTATAAGASARAAGGGDKAGNGQALSKDQQAQVDKLKERDRQVRQHEQAHLAAAGGLAMSGPSYSYQKGPDGVRYAVGGEVNIDTSPGRDSEETVAKARQIRAAALAPADPSGQDRAVAAQASQMEMQAQMEQAQPGQGQEDSKNGGDSAVGNQSDTSAKAASPRGLAAYQAMQQGVGAASESQITPGNSVRTYA